MGSVSFLEVIDRALKGRHMAEEVYDLKVFVPALKNVIEKYKIKFTPDTPVPCDDSVADSVFQAGLELYKEIGTYCVSTERVIKFSEEEIDCALSTAPCELEFGEGKDARKLSNRKPESEIPPFCFLGGVGAPVSNEKVFLSLIKGYGSIPQADSITTPSLVFVDGRRVLAGSPLEVIACIQSSRLLRDGLQSIGRPGLATMNAIATGHTDVGKIAGSHFDLRPSDGWMIGSTAEMKVEFPRLNEIAFVLNMGGHILGETGPLLGSYCGGPAGVAVTNVAYHLHSILVLRGSCQLSFPTNLRTSCSTGRDLIWAISTSAQAISRNSHFPILISPFTASGPGEEMCFFETAAVIAAIVASGSSIEALATFRGTAVDLQSPQSAKFAAEVAHGVCGCSRKEVNQVVKLLLDEYEGRIENAPRGKTYQESYDIETGLPLSETEEIYDRMKDKVSKLGIRFNK